MQLDTYGPLCDDAAKVTVTVEGRVLPGGPVFLGPAEKSLTVGDGEMPGIFFYSHTHTRTQTHTHTHAHTHTHTHTYTNTHIHTYTRVIYNI